MGKTGRRGAGGIVRRVIGATAATAGGRALPSTGSDGRAVGVADISDPAAPAQVARTPMPGEPTSVRSSSSTGWR